MTKFLKTLASGAVAAVLITGVIAVSARYVPAQEADDSPQVTMAPQLPSRKRGSRLISTDAGTGKLTLMLAAPALGICISFRAGKSSLRARTPNSTYPMDRP